MKLILSTFSNYIDLLGRAFSEVGYCVVSAGDSDSGQLIEDFHPPENVFDGVIGGPPCVYFSTANRTNRNVDEGMILVNEWKRVFIEAQPNWGLLENVPSIPDVEIQGYHCQRFNLAADECGGNVKRNRRFQFFSKTGVLLDIVREPSAVPLARTVTASDFDSDRSIDEKKALQGIDFDIPLSRFTAGGKIRTIGNSVHILVGRKLANEIKRVTSSVHEARRITDGNACPICGGEMTPNRKTCSDRCRTRLKITNKRDRTRLTETRGNTDVSKLA